jgi:hypothetical protein
VVAEKLELLILKTLALEPLHRYGIAKRIEQVSGGVFKVTLGSLYPALQRLEKDGLVWAEWKASENAHGFYDLSQFVGATYARDRYLMLVLSTFAAVAVLLAVAAMPLAAVVVSLHPAWRAARTSAADVLRAG